MGARGVLAAAMCFAAGCSERTQALIRLETDLDLSRGELAVRTRAVAFDGTRDESQPRPLVPNATFGVAPHGAIDERVMVYVDALEREGRPIVTATRTIERFEKGETIELTMFLARACSYGARTCPEGQTCSACGCEPDNRDISASTGTPCPQPITDAGVEDAEVGADLGVDAGPPPPDLGVPACIDEEPCGPAIDCSGIIKRYFSNQTLFSCIAGSGTTQARCANGACPLISEQDCVLSPEGVSTTCEVACQKTPCVPGMPYVPADYCATNSETTNDCRDYRCFFGQPNQAAKLSCENGLCTEHDRSDCDEGCSMSDGCSD